MRSRIHLMTGDITTLSVEGIVNAANQQLMGGGAWMAPFIARRGRH